MADTTYWRRLTRTLACISDRTVDPAMIRHCFAPGESDVFSHPEAGGPIVNPRPVFPPSQTPTTPPPTSPPPTSPAPTSPAPTPLPTPPPTTPVTPPPTMLVTQLDQIAPPTVAPTYDPCKSDPQGNYGTTSSTEFVVVQYLYQLDTTPLVTQSSLNSNVLSIYEKAISDALVPAMFFDENDDTCTQQTDSQTVIAAATAPESEQTDSQTVIAAATAPETETTTVTARGIIRSGGTRRRQQQLRRPHKRRLQHQQPQQNMLSWSSMISSLFPRRLGDADGTLVGMSADPPDLVLQGSAGVRCPLPVNDMADRCFVVGGGITFYGTGNFAPQAEADSKEIIRETMNSGALDDLDPDIISVRFIDTDRAAVDDNPDNGTGNESISSLPPSWSWVLIGFGALFLIGTIVYACNREKKKREAQQAADASRGNASRIQQGAFPTDMTTSGNQQGRSWGDVQSSPQSGASQDYTNDRFNDEN